MSSRLNSGGWDAQGLAELLGAGEGGKIFFSDIICRFCSDKMNTTVYGEILMLRQLKTIIRISV
jgi:hypothetical protein